MQAKHIGAYEARTHLSRVLREVAGGESFVITQRGVAVARLVPVEEDRRVGVREAITAIRARRARRSSVSAAELRAMVEEGRTR